MSYTRIRLLETPKTGKINNFVSSYFLIDICKQQDFVGGFA